MKIRKILYTAEGTPFYLSEPHWCYLNRTWYRTLYTLEGVPFFEVQGKDALRHDEKTSHEYLDEHGKRHGKPPAKTVWTVPPEVRL